MIVPLYLVGKLFRLVRAGNTLVSKNCYIIGLYSICWLLAVSWIWLFTTPLWIDIDHRYTVTQFCKFIIMARCYISISGCHMTKTVCEYNPSNVCQTLHTVNGASQCQPAEYWNIKPILFPHKETLLLIAQAVFGPVKVCLHFHECLLYASVCKSMYFDLI